MPPPSNISEFTRQHEIESTVPRGGTRPWVWYRVRAVEIESQVLDSNMTPEDASFCDLWNALYRSGDHYTALSRMSLELGIPPDDALALLLFLSGDTLVQVVNTLRRRAHERLVLAQIATPPHITLQMDAEDYYFLPSEEATLIVFYEAPFSDAVELLRVVSGLDVATAEALRRGDPGFNLRAYFYGNRKKLEALQKVLTEGLPDRSLPSLWDHLE